MDIVTMWSLKRSVTTLVLLATMIAGVIHRFAGW